jgi:hypothetical protein
MLVWVALLSCFGAMSGSAFAKAPVTASGPPLSLDKYHVTFEDDFSTLSISAQGPGTRWIAHTPWHGDFGSAMFSNPGTGVFSAGPNGLTIIASKGPDGKWRSGLIASIARDNNPASGFAQQFGYFEMEAKLPSGMGTWPAFWLSGLYKGSTATEIDVIEYYGGFPGLYHTTIHFWRDRKGDERVVSVPRGMLSSQFNRFGVLITPRTTRFYLNRQAYWTMPTPPEFRQPMYILANLALGGGWPIKGLQSPVKMQIHYIKVWQQDAPLP